MSVDRLCESRGTNIEALAIGTQVYLDKNIPATVTAVCVRGDNHLIYEVTWWSERDRKTEWVEPFEIREQEKRNDSSFNFRFQRNANDNR